MPSSTEKQKKYMAVVLAYKKGTLKGKASQKVKETARGMSKGQLEDFMHVQKAAQLDISRREADSNRMMKAMPITLFHAALCGYLQKTSTWGVVDRLKRDNLIENADTTMEELMSDSGTPAAKVPNFVKKQYVRLPATRSAAADKPVVSGVKKPAAPAVEKPPSMVGNKAQTVFGLRKSLLSDMPQGESVLTGDLRTRALRRLQEQAGSR